MSDAMIEVKVDVTAGDIAAGKRMVCKECPVAIATSRATRSVAAVGFTSIELYKVRARIFLVETPEVATNFIREFDMGKLCSPFSFTLSVPADLIRAP